MKNSPLIPVIFLLLFLAPLSSRAETPPIRGSSFGQSNYFVLNTNSIGFGQCLTITLPTAHGGRDATATLGTLAPNPFNPLINISFHLESSTVVELSIFDLGGRRVKHLVAREFPAGSNTWSWNGLSDNGRVLPAGIYLVKMKNPGNTDTRKITLVK